MLFVVRISKEQGEYDYKAFNHRADANARYQAGVSYVEGVDGWSSAWFEFIGSGGPSEAIEAVRAANKLQVRLIEFDPPKFDVSGLDLEF
jgi:hypothetical protein